MKKLLVLLFIILALVFVVKMTEAQTQTQLETVTINKSDLTATQIAKIEADEQLAKIETYGKWVGVGGEVGTAIREALNAVVDVSEKFGNTKVGTFTMYLVAWKVVGKDFVRIFLGIIFIIILTTIIFKSLRRMNTHKILKKGSWFRFWEPREYHIVQGVDYEGSEAMKFIHILALAGVFGFTYLIMFG